MRRPWASFIPAFERFEQKALSIDTSDDLTYFLHEVDEFAQRQGNDKLRREINRAFMAIRHMTTKRLINLAYEIGRSFTDVYAVSFDDKSVYVVYVTIERPCVHDCSTRIALPAGSFWARSYDEAKQIVYALHSTTTGNGMVPIQ